MSSTDTEAADQSDDGDFGDCVIVSSSVSAPDTAKHIVAQDNADQGLDRALDAIFETAKILKSPQAYNPDDGAYCVKHSARCCVWRQEDTSGADDSDCVIVSSSVLAPTSARAGVHLITAGLTC
eukprot:16099630-Heterocapsa_arctica.AAC.1